MASYLTDNDDLRFYFERGIDWEALVRTTEYEGRAADRFPTTAEAVAFYTQVAEMVGELSAEEIAPRAAKMDHDGPRLVDGEVVESEAMREVFARIREVDLHRLCLPRELGGLSAPILLYFANAEMMARADVSTMTHHSFHGGMALAMLFFSIREGTTTFDLAEAKIASTRFAAEIEEIARGDAWGCMDITEPDAGSDMAALRTRADLGDDGIWRVTGQKIFITSGHGKYHFVIARTEEAKRSDDPFAGLRGLSMFLVKTYDDLPDGKRVWYATIDRVEEKLGHHGSVTASLQFDRTPAQLIGKRGEGFDYMLVLMNNARLGVGFESIGLCEAAYRLASAYAAERRSMGKPIARHEMIADYLDEMRTDIQGLRALGMYGAFHEEMAQRGQMLLRVAPGLATPPGSEELDDGRRRVEAHRRKARRVTPLLKYLAAEKAVQMAQRCIQIHGGVGYTKEYGAEKLLRDALVMPIYEGTSQIQSLMAMKDTLMGILRRPQAFVARLGQARLKSLSARDPLERRVARIQTLSLGAQQHLVTRTAAAKLRTLGDVPLTEWPKALRQDWDPKRDFSFAMLHAERLTKLLADEAIAEILLDQAKAHPDRRELLERFLDRAEPRARAVHDELTTTGARLLATLSPPLAEAAE
ncbi:MAG: acyl-CoA dehydrogenase family protein [Deltaproteobacteria bacterium]|nr:acyl-CoA dehydrogenase family protein [Deltaproteobacteria bacterium]